MCTREREKATVELASISPTIPTATCCASLARIHFTYMRTAAPGASRGYPYGGTGYANPDAEGRGVKRGLGCPHPLSGPAKKCAIMQVAVERQCVYKLIVAHTMTNLLNAPHLMATWKVA
jgi:hypothetical protein